MYKKKRVGLIVWGAILVFSALSILLLMFATYRQEKNVSMVYFYTLLAFTLNMLAGGCLLLGFGIGNAVRVSRANNRVRRENEGYYFITTCYHCGRQVTCRFQDFSMHSRFPEGFVYCPACRTPLSIKTFTKSETSFVSQ